MMDLEDFEGLKAYLGFDAQGASALRRFQPRAERLFATAVDDFYEAIERDHEARKVIAGGESQVVRLKGTLTTWLRSVFSGVYDQAFLERHSKIGQTHVRIGLPQRFMFSAMARLRCHLAGGIAQELGHEPAFAAETTRAMHQLLDLELAIMLESYSDQWATRLRAQERLATIGELAATVGHELRNPLGTMEFSQYLMGQQLAKLGISDPTLENHRTKIATQIERCNQTITRLLDLAREQPPLARPTPLADLVEKTVAELSLDRLLKVEVHVSRALSPTLDETQFSLVLANLLRNCREAAPHGVSVNITAEELPNGFEIAVSDDGPGIRASDQSRVFDALYTTRSQGTGLGLALCRRIVEAHGGTIRIAPGDVGARFVIWLPKQEEHG